MVCPVCKTGNLPGSKGEEPTLVFRNIGFVNCEWAIRGILLRNKESKIYSDGRTYDNKLYTFKESNYRKMWINMDIIVKKLNEKNNWQNLSSERRYQNKSVSNVDDKILDSNGFEINLNAE